MLRSLSALQNSKIIITAGLAEILAGSVSMGLGGYLAGRSEIAHYDAERERELREVREIPEAEVAEIIDIFRPYGISVEALTPLIEQLKGDEEQFVNFMMKFELNLERPSKHRSWISALTIGISYLLGGFVPLMPYFFCSDPLQGLVWSSSITLLVLLIFGYIRARVLGIKKSLLSSIETMLIGAAAALVSWQVARLVSI
ncbi:hypothetical protein HMI54_001422 [Coelomomyces lativittatus]|nr:hypothetical protein HMI54_001422 [Coelomomyces lativittatus]